jgi:hypothetical protein
MRASLHEPPRSVWADQSVFRASETAPGALFLLHFESLFQSGRGFEFPCDEKGLVNLDTLPTRTRNNYLYARAMLGREFAWPSVRYVSAG